MITLITPPDIFENENQSFVFMNISDQEQEQASLWLSQNSIDKPINLYYYQGETNIPWLLHAVAISKGVYLNCENNSDVTKWITSYILGKPNVWYKATDPNFRALMDYINQKTVNNISEFLEVHLGK
tara:strand:- start:142 stop:522 length:381 start_codon:yes stop_codon:yes gene_type:complete